VYARCSIGYGEVERLFIAREEEVRKKKLETYGLLIRMIHTDHQSIWPAIRMVIRIIDPYGHTDY